MNTKLYIYIYINRQIFPTPTPTPYIRIMGFAEIWPNVFFSFKTSPAFF